MVIYINEQKLTEKKFVLNAIGTLDWILEKKYVSRKTDELKKKNVVNSNVSV